METYPRNRSKRPRHMRLPFLPKRGIPYRQKWFWKVILNALFYVLRTGCRCLGQNGTSRTLSANSNLLTLVDLSPSVLAIWAKLPSPQPDRFITKVLLCRALLCHGRPKSDPRGLRRQSPAGRGSTRVGAVYSVKRGRTSCSWVIDSILVRRPLQGPAKSRGYRGGLRFPSHPI